MTMGLSGHVVMPSDIRRSGRRSSGKPFREWKAIGRVANERKTNEQAAIGKLAFGKIAFGKIAFGKRGR